jgi:hypothetical protein
VRSAGYRVEPINVARSADDPERFANLKAQRYWFLRERFQAGGISGLSDALFEELAPIGYVIDPRGRTAIEDKAAVRSSIGRSPDLAEALMLAAGDHDAHIDLSFQNRAAELFASQTAGRQQGFDAVVDPGDRLYARQPDFSIAEDRAQAMAKYSHRKK